MKDWLPIPGYEGVYAVSRAGQVMSMNYKQTGLPGLLTLQPDRKGYLKVYLCDNGKAKNATVHSLVMLTFAGPRPAGACVNHKNGRKDDNRLENLEYATYAENNRHALRTGLRTNRGEKHSRAKLTEAKVDQIRAYLAAGMKQADIARLMGVHQSNISFIKSGKLWGHMTRQPAALGG